VTACSLTMIVQLYSSNTRRKYLRLNICDKLTNNRFYNYISCPFLTSIYVSNTFRYLCCHVKERLTVAFLSIVLPGLSFMAELP
jgi:hypothetical protein